MTTADDGPAGGPVEGARTFSAGGAAYDAYMGRYSRPLAVLFADAAGVGAGMSALDVGCGPGALTGVLAERLGAAAVSACDPSAPFVADCAARHPGVDVREGRAEAIPFADGAVDVAMAQLVLHFVTDAPRAAAELRRVLRPGGTVAACVWDFAGGMQMLRLFWDAALAVDPGAPDEARTLRFGREGEIAELLGAAGFDDVTETTLTVGSTYSGTDELWSGFERGIGPAGAYCLSLPDDARAEVRRFVERALVERGLVEPRAGSPAGPFTLHAVARCVTARAPG